MMLCQIIVVENTNFKDGVVATSAEVCNGHHGEQLKGMRLGMNQNIGKETTILAYLNADVVVIE